MDCNEYEIKVPGKLFIAGEYAVLEPGYDSIVVAIDRFITVRIRSSETSSINLVDIGLMNIGFTIQDTIRFDIEDERMDYVKESFLVVHEFLKSRGMDMNPFILDISSSLNDEETGKKYGLGSSAAIVVATISAILCIHQNKSSKVYHQDKELIFKLAAIAHVRTQGNGSGADIAAAVYGGWNCYRSFDYKWLLRKLESLRKVSDVLDIPWVHLNIQKISSPRQVALCVGWTKEAAITKGMVSKVEEYRENHIGDYKIFLKESKIAVERIMNGFANERVQTAFQGIQYNRQLLEKLGKDSNVDIITSDMSELCRIADQYGAGKSSGAGGGDCGIALVPMEHKAILEKKWRDVGIKTLNLNVEQGGIQYVKIS